MKKKIPHCVASGFTYGAVLGMFLFLINTPSDSTIVETLKILLISVICALLSGLIFTLLIYFLDKNRAKKFQPFREELLKTQKILFDDEACRLLNGKQVRGWLFLTAERLYFKPLGDEAVREISRADIASVEVIDPRRGQIAVSTSSLEVESFTVTDPVQWFQLLGASDSESAEPASEDPEVEEKTE